MSTTKHLRILGGSASGFTNIKLESRELAYDTTNKILYIGVDGTKTGSNNTPLSSAIIEKESFPSDDLVRTDKFYWLSIDYDTYTKGLYYFNRNHKSDDDKWIKIELSTDVIDDSSQSKSTTYSSDKIVELLEQYQADFLGSFETKKTLDDATTAKTITPNNNDIAIVLKDEDHNNKCCRYRYIVTINSGVTSGAWTYEYTISNGSISGDNKTITTVTEDSNIIVKFVTPSDSDVNKVWRAIANVDGSVEWKLDDLSDKQDKLTAGDGISIDTSNKTISINDTIDIGSWDSTSVDET